MRPSNPNGLIIYQSFLSPRETCYLRTFYLVRPIQIKLDPLMRFVYQKILKDIEENKDVFASQQKHHSPIFYIRCWLFINAQKLLKSFENFWNQPFLNDSFITRL